VQTLAAVVALVIANNEGTGEESLNSHRRRRRKRGGKGDVHGTLSRRRAATVEVEVYAVIGCGLKAWWGGLLPPMGGKVGYGGE
jgi:hypothetical protein